MKRELHRSMLFPILCCVIQGVQFENDQKSNAGALQRRIIELMVVKQNSVKRWNIFENLIPFYSFSDIFLMFHNVL